MKHRELDVVLFGATGFTGRQTAQYFRDHAPAALRWAIGARNQDRLNEVHASLGLPESVERIVADSMDRTAMQRLAERARVVLTTVGPYAQYGEALIASCAAAGTHYVDITGETVFVRRMIDAYDEVAREHGAKIIPFCGFDSIPADLSVQLAQREIRERFREETASATAYYSIRGSFNGGTFHSGLNMYASGDYRLMQDPALLLPPNPVGVEPPRDPAGSFYDSEIKSWVAPFLMGFINARVVHRSAALAASFGDRYGPAFAYHELHRQGGLNPLPSLATAGGLATVRALGPFSVFRSIAGLFGPDPGDGPSEKSMDRGSYRLDLIARSTADRRVHVVMSDQGDPGNRATVKFVCESALALALDEERLPGGSSRVGFLTPATGLGSVLMERLRSAGVQLQVEDEQKLTTR
ncbi:MAG: saccharopine dehydrogenase NADP-binding domain-containing protein [Spirochaetales bacterium]|nr:saccharopine dehydrogenase NADP-binding domain-containing protein [Spirochaetales bacterium]MCP5485714.1 saccharopine dehydrogenase NADP-binding domain-containing protein [Spirochaetales bacterium]